MADQKRWFKVWTSILDDPHFQELSLEEIGRWVLLGAMTALTGERGRLSVPGTARRLREVLRLREAETLFDAIKPLPHVSLSDTFEEGKRVNGEQAVTWKNWRRYQEDSTVAQRVKRLRSKRRGEEIRGEEIPQTPISSPVTEERTNGLPGPDWQEPEDTRLAREAAMAEIKRLIDAKSTQ